MSGSADTAWMPDGRSRRAFFRCDIVRHNQALETKLKSTPDFSHSEMCAARGPFSDMRFGHICSLSFLNSSSVAAFRGSNSDGRNEVCFAASRRAREISAPEAPHSHTAFLNIRPASSSEGERCMKYTVHPLVHLSVHVRISRRVRSRRSCASRDDHFGRGQNTGLGWSDPTFGHGNVPKVIRGVAPAQLRVGRAACFVCAAFCSRGPQ